MIWNLLYKCRYILFAYALCCVGASLYLVSDLKTDPTNHAVLEHDEAYEKNLFFQKTFGSDDSIVIGIGDANVLTEPVLKWIRLLSDQLAKNEAILNTESILEIPRVDRTLLKVSAASMGERYFSGEESLDDFIERVRSDKEVSNALLSADGLFTAVVAHLKSPLSSEQRKSALDEVESWISSNRPPEGRLYFSGTAVEQDRFIHKIQHDHETFVPITFILIMVTLLTLQRNLAALLYPAAVILTTLLTAQALMVLSNVPLNMMTTLVSPVILIVAVGDVVHLQSHAGHLGLRERPGQLIRATFHSLFTPCLLTTLTTMAGFLSLSFNRIPAVREFGIFAALGTALAFFWTFFLAPVFMTLHVTKKQSAIHQKWSRRAADLAGFAVKFRALILLGGLALLLLGSYGIRHIQVETNILESFKAEDPFRQDTEMFHEKLGGVYPLELMLQSPDKEAFKTTESFEALENFKTAVLGLPGISNVKYLTDIIRVIDRGVRKSSDEGIPQSYLERYLNGMAEDPSQKISRYASHDYEWTRMSAFLTVSGTAAVMNISDQIKQLALEMLPKGWVLSVTGQTYLLARMSQRLARNEMQSILIAMIVIWSLLVLWSKSLKVGILTLIVNAIPLTVILGVMPFLHIKLNTATAMIGAVAVGLIVDNTIHVLFRFRESEPSFKGSRKAVEHVMSYCAQPMISSTLILMIGFSVTLMGSIKPTIEFGMLMVLITFAALISNLFVLPALLVGGKRNV